MCWFFRPKRSGDGYCDDDNNNFACNWDGGDCCREEINTTFCKECKCLDSSGTEVKKKKKKEEKEQKEQATWFGGFA